MLGALRGLILPSDKKGEFIIHPFNQSFPCPCLRCHFRYAGNHWKGALIGIAAHSMGMAYYNQALIGRTLNRIITGIQKRLAQLL